jgi:hypothetical protein
LTRDVTREEGQWAPSIRDLMDRSVVENRRAAHGPVGRSYPATGGGEAVVMTFASPRGGVVVTAAVVARQEKTVLSDFTASTCQDCDYPLALEVEKLVLLSGAQGDVSRPSACQEPRTSLFGGM